MQSQLSFELENPAETEAVAILIPAMLRRSGSLKGKFLQGVKFKDESGAIEIAVTGILPAGSIDELNEYASQLTGIKVLGATVITDSLAQGTMIFMEKTYIEFKPAAVANIDTATTLVAGQAAVHHTFARPFESAAMKSLEMKLLPGQKVGIVLMLDMPDFSNMAAIQSAAILPNQ